MKLATFVRSGEGDAQFGVALDDATLISFATLQRRCGTSHAELACVETYLAALPSSEQAARGLHAWAVDHRRELAADLHDAASMRFLAAVPKPPAMLDFGLTPRHLKNSAATMLRYEYGPIAGRLAAAFVHRRIARTAESPVLLYYKCNHCEVIGDGDTTGWPAYSSYVDIEPELAVVAGTEAQPLAGYVIFNDMSARDVQMPEMMGSGPARSKDFARSNGIGPYLVTADEVPEPRALAVDVRVTDAHRKQRFHWRGSTSEYSHTPQQIFEFLRTVFTPPPGTVIGMGTVPDCTGLDNDLWLHPGDAVQITFDRIGTLRQQLPSSLPPLETSRWPARPELVQFRAR